MCVPAEEATLHEKVHCWL